MSHHVLIMAAGTGGHIFPGLAVAKCLSDRGAKVTWLGTKHGLENRVVPQAGINLEQITIEGVRGKGWLGWITMPFKLLRALIQVRRIFRRTRPSACLSMGGYVAGPGGLMARLMGLPLIIHEQNAIAGLTNRCLAPFAQRIFSGFPNVLKNAEFVGNPVRAEIEALSHPQIRWSQRQGPIRLLVIGGSQGARIFAQRLPLALAEAARIKPDLALKVIHQAGRVLDEAKAAYAAVELPDQIEVEVLEFIDQMATAWGEADVALTRAGALTIAELTAAGVGALLVPFGLAVDQHQSANALFLSEAGAAWQIEEADFSVARLADWLVHLDRDELLQHATRARALAHGGSAKSVADACWELAA